MIGQKDECKRIRWIDATRGIAILLTILGHCIGVVESAEYRFILSFHMPLFFFLSGLCVKVSGGFAGYFKHKVKTILCPQITFCVLQCIMDLIREPSQKLEIIENLFSWFLVVLFYVSILFYWIYRMGFQKSRMVRLLTYFCLGILIVLMDKWQIQTVLHLEIIPMAMVFFLLGVHVSILREINYKWFAQSWIILIPVLVCCSFWNEPVIMYLNTYGNLILFFVGAFCGIDIACNVGRCMENNKILIWFGQNSIYCFVLHFALIKGLHFAVKCMFPQFENYRYPIYWCYFLLCVLILMVIVPICDSYLSPIFGKWNKSGKLFQNNLRERKAK